MARRRASRRAAAASLLLCLYLAARPSAPWLCCDGFVLPAAGTCASRSRSTWRPSSPSSGGHRSGRLRHASTATASADAPADVAAAPATANRSLDSTYDYGCMCDAIQLLEEADAESVLDGGGGAVRYRVRCRIKPPGRTDDNGDDEGERGGAATNMVEVCRGALIQPPPNGSRSGGSRRMEARITPLSIMHDCDDDIVAQGRISDRFVEMTVARVVDSLLLQRLILERSEEEEGADGVDAMADLIFVVETGGDDGDDIDDASAAPVQKAILSRGMVALAHNEEDEKDGGRRLRFRMDYGRLVRSYSELALENRGTALGMEALEILGLLSSRRIPYQFDDCVEDGVASTSPRGTTTTRSVVVPQRDLLPKTTIDRVKDIMSTIEGNGWLSTNLDSVDNLPSLHLNLISEGAPLFPTMEGADDDDFDDVDTPISFENSIGALWRLVKPHLEEKLLPSVRDVMGSPTVEISDVFIRRYGEDVQPDHFAATRYGISAHFDVTASTTSVVALDDVAAEGRSGLYTTETGEICTNHAALRRYFPLRAGDAVVHTWDVLHGVEIDPGQQRTSLIVWFEDRGIHVDGNQSLACPPWLSNPAVGDDVGQFVLATATSGSVDERVLPRGDESTDEFHPHNLYIRSAALGNAFALTSLGSLGNEGCLSSEMVAQSREMLKELRGHGNGQDHDALIDADAKALAIELWYEAAIRGNPLAQTSLADEYMGQSMEAMRACEVDSESAAQLRLKAATLFALAAQQGYDDALQALPRVLSVESSTHGSAEDFYNSPVFQIAQAVLA